MAFCTSCGFEVKGAFCGQCGAPAPGSSAAQPQQSEPQPPGAFTPPTPVGPAYPPAAPAVVARRTSPIVWVVVAVLGLFVLFIVGIGLTGWYIARNPARLLGRIITAANPNAEVVRVDNGSKEITIRDRRNGQEVTMSFDDVKNGRLHFSAIDEHGKVAHLEIGGGAAKLPSWVPAYPGAAMQSAMSGTGSDGDSTGEGGIVTFSTPDAPAKVMDFYQGKCKDLGMKVELTTASADGGMITAVDEDGQRTIHVIVATGSGNGSSGTITYGRKR
jgi:hypothetical protein